MGQFTASLLASDAAVRARFVAELRATGSFSAAARATGTVRTTANRLRRRDPAFDAACAAAQKTTAGREPVTAAARIEAALIARALHGTRRTRRLPGGVTEVWFEFDDRMSLQLLTLLKKEVATVAAAPVRTMTRDDFIAAIEGRRRTTDLSAEPEAEV